MERDSNIKQFLTLNKLRDEVVNNMQTTCQFESLAKEGQKLINEGAHKKAQENFCKTNESIEYSLNSEKEQASSSKNSKDTVAQSLNKFGKVVRNYIGVFQKRKTLNRTSDVSIRENLTLRLGEPFTHRDRLAKRLKKNVYQLRKSVFGEVAAIFIYLRSANKIGMIRFDYRPDTNYTEEIAFYSKTLGPPTETKVGESLEKTVWDDGISRFEYIRNSTCMERSLYSLLYEKQLC